MDRRRPWCFVGSSGGEGVVKSGERAGNFLKFSRISDHAMCHWEYAYLFFVLSPSNLSLATGREEPRCVDGTGATVLSPTFSSSEPLLDGQRDPDSLPIGWYPCSRGACAIRSHTPLYHVCIPVDLNTYSIYTNALRLNRTHLSENTLPLYTPRRYNYTPA